MIITKHYSKLIKTILLGTMTLVGFTQPSRGQYYANYSQFISNYHVINPAYAGADDALSITLVNRAQWLGVEGAPSTQTFTGHSLIKNEKTGIGITLINDKIGVHNSLTFLGTYAYRINLDNKSNRYLSFGLQSGVIARKSDYSSLDPEDPVLIGLSDRKTSFAFGSGVYYQSQRLKLGISVPNLLRRDLGSEIINNSVFTHAEYLLMGMYKIPMSYNLTLQPAVLIKYLPDLPVSYDLNLSAVVNEALLVGAGYSSSEMVSGIIQASFSRQLKLGYSYDYSISNKSVLFANAHEIMINFLFKIKSADVIGPRY